MRRLTIGLLMVLILPLTACTVVEADHGYRDYPRHGGYYPPPSRGHWRWDDDLRVYVSAGYPRVYYHDHTYYRWHDNRWASGRHFNGPWRGIEHRHVPSRLGQRYYSPPRHDDRRYDHRRDDGWRQRGDRYYDPYRREWQNQHERREAEQRFQQRRDTDRDGRDSRWERNVLERHQNRNREWPQQRPGGGQDRHWQQRDQRHHEQRAEQRQRQERRASSRPTEQRGERSSHYRDDGRGGARQGRGER